MIKLHLFDALPAHPIVTDLEWHEMSRVLPVSEVLAEYVARERAQCLIRLISQALE